METDRATIKAGRQKIRAVAFDLDDTLAHSKAPVSTTMAQLLAELAELLPICIISGGRFEQFQQQLLSRLPNSGPGVANLHLMPTCGTRYYRSEDGGWLQVYAEDLTVEEKAEATSQVERIARALNLWESSSLVYGPRIEDRGSQITYSALGQEAPVVKKKEWDADGGKRRLLQLRIQAELPGLEVRAGGSTSIDITRKGVDKAHGIREFARRVGLEFERILFVGDRLAPGW